MKYPKLASEPCVRGRPSLEAIEKRKQAWHAKHGPHTYPDDNGNPVTNFIVRVPEASKPVSVAPVAVVATNTSETVKEVTEPNLAAGIKELAANPTPLKAGQKVFKNTGDEFTKLPGYIVKVDKNFSYVAWATGKTYWFPNALIHVQGD